MSCDLTALVLVQKVLKYRQHATHTVSRTPIPTLLRIIPYLGGKLTDITSRRSPGLCVVFWLSLLLGDLLNVCSQSQDKWTMIGGYLLTSLSPDTMTVLVFMHETLPLVRKIRVDRIVDLSEISTSHYGVPFLPVNKTLFLFLGTFECSRACLVYSTKKKLWLTPQIWYFVRLIQGLPFGCRADSSVWHQPNRTEVSSIGSPQPSFDVLEIPGIKETVVGVLLL